jgi:MFS family permease
MSQNEVQEEVEPVALAEEHIAEHQTESLLVEEPEPIAEEESSALPWKPLTVVFLMWVCDLFAFTTLVYLPFMVQDFNITENPNDVGYYVGIIGSLYFVGQFISCFVWGWVSDKYGRRPVLLLGMLGSIITSIMFGFATNIYLAFSARLLFGLLNGNLGIFKTYAVHNIIHSLTGTLVKFQTRRTNLVHSQYLD